MDHPKPRIGQYQAFCGYIMGYYDTMHEAQSVASHAARENALVGRSGYHTEWRVGIVTWTGSNTIMMAHQELPGIMVNGYNHYDVVSVSIVASGYATYQYHRTHTPKGIAQGKVR